MKLEFSWWILEKNSHVKFSENPSIGMGVVPQEWVEEEAHMSKLPFRSFV
jgi:hypothetical protein